MTHDHTENSDFEAELGIVLLEAFADGETVEGTWNLETIPEEIPDWTVHIEKIAFDAED